MTVQFDVTPMAKPRMVRSDSWKKRDAVERYWAFKEELNLEANLLKFHLADEFAVEFYIPMPASWSKKHKREMLGKPHRHKPDADNLVKAVMDCLREDDSGIWNLTIRKYWSDSGRIVIRA